LLWASDRARESACVGSTSTSMRDRSACGGNWSATSGSTAAMVPPPAARTSTGGHAQRTVRRLHGRLVAATGASARMPNGWAVPHGVVGF